jgi:transposase
VLAAIVFVATSGCTWQQLPSASFGPSGATALGALPSPNPVDRGKYGSKIHMAWLAGCRRIHRRYEHKADHFLAFTSIACTLICYRRLAK